MAKKQTKTDLASSYLQWELDFVKLIMLGWSIDRIVSEGGLDIDEQTARSFVLTNRYTELKNRSRELALNNINESVSYLCSEALGTIEKCLKSKNESIALKAAQDILDRAGIKQIDLNKKDKVSFTPKEIKGILNEFKDFLTVESADNKAIAIHTSDRVIPVKQVKKPVVNDSIIPNYIDDDDILDVEEQVGNG